MLHLVAALCMPTTSYGKLRITLLPGCLHQRVVAAYGQPSNDDTAAAGLLQPDL